MNENVGSGGIVLGPEQVLFKCGLLSHSSHLISCGEGHGQPPRGLLPGADSWESLSVQTGPQASSWGHGRKLEEPGGGRSGGQASWGRLLEAQGLCPLATSCSPPRALSLTDPVEVLHGIMPREKMRRTESNGLCRSGCPGAEGPKPLVGGGRKMRRSAAPRVRERGKERVLGGSRGRHTVTGVPRRRQGR